MSDHSTKTTTSSSSEQDLSTLQMKDLEAQLPEPVPQEEEVQEESEEKTAAEEDEFLVQYSGPEDKRNPYNWTYKKKMMLTVLVSFVTFISPATSSIVAPANEAIVKELHITNTYIQQMVVSIFVLGYVFGPMVLAPLSELYGRRPVFQYTNFVFLAFNLGCGFAQTTTQLLVCRFFAGFAGSVPQSIGAGTLGDMFTAEERGKAFSIYSLAPLIGPALGPIAGGFIAENTTWRWAFWATTIADFVVVICLFIWLQETYGPQLLREMALRKRKETGDDRYYSKFDGGKVSFAHMMTKNLVRPLKFLVTQPIIQFIAIYMAFLYGTMYLLLTTFPALWTEKYHESVGIGGLNYIALSVGMMAGAQIGSRLLDKFYRKLKAKNEGVGRPEFRVPLMMISSMLFPIGMFIYGWSGNFGVFWLVPDIGMAIALFGLVMCFTPLQVYIVDSFGQYAASATAACSMLRSLCGFALPLAGPKLYENLGFGWGNSLLAFVALGVGLPLPFILWKFGRAIRLKSKYAVKV